MKKEKADYSVQVKNKKNTDAKSKKLKERIPDVKTD